MNHDKPLYWQEGQLLQPQHLQHVDRLNERHVAYALAAAMPWAWGVECIEVNEQALASGQFSLGEFAARFPDGTRVQHPGNALVEARSFAPAELVSGPRVVYVGIRRMAAGEANCSVFERLDDAVRAATRYATTTDPEPLNDDLAGDCTAPARTMRHVLRIFWDSESTELAHYDLMPVAAIEMAAGNIRLVPAFVPPATRIGASRVLAQTLCGVRDELVGRASQLSGSRMAADTMTIGVDSAQLRMMMATALFSRYAPLLSHLVETPSTHPWHAYGVLRQLIGELSVFSNRFDMRGRLADRKTGVEPYRHEVAGEQFASLAVLIGAMLNEIAFGPDQAVALACVDDIWSADLPEGFVTGRNRYYLIVNGIDDNEDAIAFAQQARVAAPSELPELVSHALPGLELLPLAVPPAGIPRHPDSRCFRVETVSEIWSSVTRERGIALFCGTGVECRTVELVMMRR